MLPHRILAALLALSLALAGCSGTALERYTDSRTGYEFRHPNSWVSVDVSEASGNVDALFRDLVERTENLSVVISEVEPEQNLEGLGTPSEVGRRLIAQTLAPSASQREAQLLSARQKREETQTYYQLEYRVELPESEPRHNLASVAVSRGKLFTLSVSTPQRRWEQRADTFQTVVDSFYVY